MGNLVAFTLSMPNRGSWDGRWSGEGTVYAIVRNVPHKDRPAGLIGSHSYAWNDGWCAMVTARDVDSSEARRLRAASKGFCGYDWMVNSLLIDGRILASHERKPLTNAERAQAQEAIDRG